MDIFLHSILLFVTLSNSYGSNEDVCTSTKDKKTQTCITRSNKDQFSYNYKRCTFSENNVPPGELKGHFKPFGESGSKVPIQEINGFPSDVNQNFYHRYLLPSVPVLMKAAVSRSPHFHKWTDYYLLRESIKEENRHFEISVEAGKKESRDDEGLYMKFHEFLEVYNTSDLYMVSDLTPWMESLSWMPCPLQCAQTKEVRTKYVMWLSSGGTKSVVHTDASENINCLYRGNKTLVMLDPNTIGTGTIIDDLDRSFSKLDVDRVDLNRYPTLRGAQFTIASMEAGDCLYIPQFWIHQVRSFGSNLAINVWFDGSHTRDVLSKSDCTDDDFTCDPTFTLARVQHPVLEEDEDELSQNEAIYLMRLVFQYLTVHGKPPVSQGDDHSMPVTRGDEKVKLEDFIRELIRQISDFIFNTKLHRTVNNEYSARCTNDKGTAPDNIDKDDCPTRKRKKDYAHRTDQGIMEAFGDVIRRQDTNSDEILTLPELEKGIGEMWRFLAAEIGDLFY